MRIPAYRNNAFTFLSRPNLLQNLKTLAASIYALTIGSFAYFAKTIIRLITFGWISFKKRKRSIQRPSLYYRAAAPQEYSKKLHFAPTYPVKQATCKSENNNNNYAETPFEKRVKDTEEALKETLPEIHSLLMNEIKGDDKLSEAVNLISFLGNSKPVIQGSEPTYAANSHKTLTGFSMDRPAALEYESCVQKGMENLEIDSLSLLHQLQQFYAFTMSIKTKAIKSTCMSKLVDLVQAYLKTFDAVSQPRNCMHATIQPNTANCDECNRVKSRTYEAYAYLLAYFYDFIEYSTKDETRKNTDSRLKLQLNGRVKSGKKLNEFLLGKCFEKLRTFTKFFANFISDTWLNETSKDRVTVIVKSFGPNKQRIPQAPIKLPVDANTDATKRLSHYVSGLNESIDKLAAEAGIAGDPPALTTVPEEIASSNTSGRSTPHM